MAQSSTIQATLLYHDIPDLPVEALHASLRDLAGQHGLTISSAADQSGDLFRLSALPYEITIQVSDAALPAATFNGALGCAKAAHRGPLGKFIADHRAHLRIAVRNTSETACATVVAPENESGEPKRNRTDLVICQDVTRAVMSQMPPLALHWHPSNQLVLPAVLAEAEPGKLYVPICLRMRCTSALIPDTTVVNMSQSIEGAQGLLGRPLHVMTTSLDRPTTLALATAFVECMLDAEARPIGGAIFRDRDGNRVRVIEQAPGEGSEFGLIALVEAEASERSQPVATPEETACKAVTASRNQVAAREEMKRKDRVPRILPDFVQRFSAARRMVTSVDLRDAQSFQKSELRAGGSELPADVLATKHADRTALDQSDQRSDSLRPKTANPRR